MEISFASQKQYVALYVMRGEVLEAYRDELKASSIGMGCVRFTKPERIDFGVVARLLNAVAAPRSQA